MLNDRVDHKVTQKCLMTTTKRYDVWLHWLAVVDEFSVGTMLTSLTIVDDGLNEVSDTKRARPLLTALFDEDNSWWSKVSCLCFRLIIKKWLDKNKSNRKKDE